MTAVLDEEEIAELLNPYLREIDHPIPPKLIPALREYLALLLTWGARTNLSAIRSAQEIVRRHFGESLLLGDMIPDEAATLLDLGSGAGLPGLPIQLLRPGLEVTLAESQGKKAVFLREVVRTLGLPTSVYQGRAELLQTRYDVVALRAVDKMAKAVTTAAGLGGRLLLLSSASELQALDLRILAQRPIPGTREGRCVLGVPRGT